MAYSILGVPREASPRLKAIQYAQLSIAILSAIATFLAAVIPQKHKAFTFSLLYSLILISLSTTLIVRKEQLAVKKGILTKDKYVKYQLFKMLAAVGLSVVGFIGFAATPAGPHKSLASGESGLLMNGYKVNRWQAWIMWLSMFNWVFLWASLFYSCCMTGNKQGAIALQGEEANIGIEDDESVARAQAQDP